MLQPGWIQYNVQGDFTAERMWRSKAGAEYGSATRAAVKARLVSLFS